MTRQLVRPDDRLLGGVCAGIADRYGMSATTVRLLFAVSFLLPGPQFVVYLVLWVMMPDARKIGQP